MRARVLNHRDQDPLGYCAAVRRRCATPSMPLWLHVRLAPKTKTWLKLELHHAASLRWDYISSENRKGFHSPHEAARLLASFIDFARQAELEDWKAMRNAQEDEKKE
ncbi:ammonia-forming cytochrome c nitrite reductase subunit c552 [candidate division KSB1 bacterium]|nr:ammonia-forming cytochrome c nitrite reductase subunit c552 [candidate division KSB1 bacterium]